MRTRFPKSVVYWWLGLVVCGIPVQTSAAERPNVLIMTVDDMSADSVGAFGCQLPETTPHLDRLAAQGMRFLRAHVVVGNCMPSRNVMWSGLYPHNNRVEGFYQVPDARHPHLADLMQRAGYFTAIQHKVSHSTPYAPYPAWDLELDVAPDGQRRDVKSPRSYGEGAAQGLFDPRDAPDAARAQPIARPVAVTLDNQMVVAPLAGDDAAGLAWRLIEEDLDIGHVRRSWAASRRPEADWPLHRGAGP